MSTSLEALAAALSAPRVVWVMVPSGEPTRATVASLGEVLESGDIIIDGGNSRYTDDQAHAAALEPKGIRYLDAGVSGGVWGLTEGYALMVGGDADTVAVAQPIFDSLKPPTRRLRACRPGRCRALHQDGPQRHRVRDHAGLRRGLRAAQGRRLRARTRTR